MIKYQRIKILRFSSQVKKGFELRQSVAEKRKSVREKLYVKLIRYLSVWAHRRKKRKWLLKRK